MDVDAGSDCAANTAAATPPVSQPRRQAWQVAPFDRADAGVLNKEDAVSRGGESESDFLRVLAVEVPVDRGNADDVRAVQSEIS